MRFYAQHLAMATSGLEDFGLWFPDRGLTALTDVSIHVTGGTSWTTGCVFVTAWLEPGNGLITPGNGPSASRASWDVNITGNTLFNKMLIPLKKLTNRESAVSWEGTFPLANDPPVSWLLRCTVGNDSGGAIDIYLDAEVTR